jgi:predicted enzyme related to lactoylglutathione lyase
MTITSAVVRLQVDDLDAAVSFYEKMTGSAASRFAFAGVSLTAVGPFLLFSGSGEAVQRVAGVKATLPVPDLNAAVEAAVAAGAEVVMPSAQTPNGHRAVVRHPHGGVFEYTGP